MITSLIVVTSILLIASGASWLLLRSEIGRTFLRYRGKRLVRCPETNTPAVVEVAALFAGLPPPLGLPRLRVKSCSMSPERDQCAQACVWQIRAAPRDTLLKTVLRRYEEGECVLCGRSLGPLRRPTSEAGLEGLTSRNSPGVTRALRGIAATQVPDALAVHGAMCRDCRAIDRRQIA
jgi:hypothetical protein